MNSNTITQGRRLKWFRHLKRKRSNRFTKMILGLNAEKKMRRGSLGKSGWMDGVRRSTITKDFTEDAESRIVAKENFLG